jgi:hypothetical protein
MDNYSENLNGSLDHFLLLRSIWRALMAMLITEKNVPEPGDVVKEIEFSDDREVVWITFQSGKTVTSHVS